MRLNDMPATMVAKDDKIAVRASYELLGAIQSKLTDLEDFERRGWWREDWRGWVYDPECPL